MKKNKCREIGHCKVAKMETVIFWRRGIRHQRSINCPIPYAGSGWIHAHHWWLKEKLPVEWENWWVNQAFNKIVYMILYSNNSCSSGKLSENMYFSSAKEKIDQELCL